jgi:DNA-binding transcriptional MocR family regulator
MTIWLPQPLEPGRPAYLALADAIGDGIRLGQLRPGDQLPTHRRLADLLGVNVSTITRAYQEAARRRFLGGEVGRGTFVLGVASEAALFASQQRPQGGVIDLSANVPPVLAQDPDLAKALGAVDPADAARWLHYPGAGDALVHRQAATRWLARRGVATSVEDLLVCAGAQHAMDTALSLFPDVEEVACETLVYPGLKAAARRWQRRLHPLAMDGEGILPSAFETACRGGIRLAVFSPTLHNPTTVTMPLARRLALVAIARKWDVLLVEEDVYGLLREDAPPPLAALAPERVIYLTGLSKTVAPGLRLGYLAFPAGLRKRIKDVEAHTSWYVAPLSMALATRWMEDGTAWRRLLAQRKELAARHRLCRERLQGYTWSGEACCPHLWITSPPGGSERFTQRALEAGVVVVPASVFAAGRLARDGIRLSIGAATDRGALGDALGRLAGLR